VARSHTHHFPHTIRPECPGGAAQLRVRLRHPMPARPRPHSRVCHAWPVPDGTDGIQLASAHQPPFTNDDYLEIVQELA